MSTTQREAKLPKYQEGIAREDYVVRFLATARTRDKEDEVYDGTVLQALQANADTNNNTVTLRATAVKTLIERNTRALADLFNIQPTKGKVLRKAREAKTTYLV